MSCVAVVVEDGCECDACSPGLLLQTKESKQQKMPKECERERERGAFSLFSLSLSSPKNYE